MAPMCRPPSVFRGLVVIGIDVPPPLRYWGPGGPLARSPRGLWYLEPMCRPPSGFWAQVDPSLSMGALVSGTGVPPSLSRSLWGLWYMAPMCRPPVNFYRAHPAPRSVWGLSIWHRCAAPSASASAGSLLVGKPRHQAMRLNNIARARTVFRKQLHNETSIARAIEGTY